MRSSLSGLLLLPLLATFTVSAGAVERRISKKDLPSAVQKTADELARGATVRGYTKDNEDGQWEYEVEMTTGGHSKDVSIAPDGSVLEVEEQVNMGSLSPQARAALTSKAGKGRITKIESITKHGNIVAYEAQVMTAGKHSEIQVGPNGENLNREE